MWDRIVSGVGDHGLGCRQCRRKFVLAFGAVAFAKPVDFGASKQTYHNNMFCSLILIYLINLDNIVLLSFFFPFPWDAIAFSLAKLIKFSKCLLYFVFNKPTIVVCGHLVYILGNFLKGIFIMFE
jgi:hypothetical protein